MRSKILVALAVAGLMTLPAQAQEWPTKQPVRVVIPFTAGSGTDIVARTVFEQVGRQIGQAIVFENRGGAGTTVGSLAVMNAAPDGYTLLVNSTSHVVVASTYANLAYHPVNDFTPVTILAELPFVIAARAKYKTLKDLVNEGKAKPNSLNYGSAGAGSSGQLFIERFRIAAGFEAPHVPFRGTPEALTEIMGDRLDLFPAPAANVVGLAAEGKLSSLAISSRKRLPMLPQVPTTVEAGYPNSEYNFWVGALLPPKADPALVTRIHAQVKAALNNPDVQKKIEALGGQTAVLEPKDFTAFLHDELKLNADIVKASGFKPQ